MPSFKDANGREWLVKIDAPTIADVRKELSIDLARLDERTFAALIDDPCLLVDVLWMVCRAQANGSTDRQFGEAICGDALDAATKALLDGVADFFPARKRLLLRSLGEKNAALMDKMMGAMEAKINDPAWAAEIEAAMLAGIEEKMQLRSPTNARESSGSAPTD